MGIGMLLAATKEPAVRAALEPLVAAFAPRSAAAFVVLFGGLSWLALYRGPLNPYGVGILVYTVLAGLGILPPVMLVAAVMAVVQVQNVCDPTNTQNVWVANFSGVTVDEITKLTLPFQVGVAIAGVLAAALFAGPLLHVEQPFGAALPEPLLAAPAAAATPSAQAGLYAPPAARNVIAVGGSGTFGEVAARTIRESIERGWSGFSAIALVGDPATADCAQKEYAAVLRVESAETIAERRPVVETDATLSDCAGWPVDEFHESAALTHPAGDDDARAGALAALFRLRVWTHEHPGEARSLFGEGLARSAAPRSSYLFSFFKTVDGNMRAFVRPGGPAWNAGLRTNDVVDKVDGKWWWEYGTYQTQLRAYDGKPHTLEVHRGPERVTITLAQ
jgi:hypothetical protein